LGDNRDVPNFTAVFARTDTGWIGAEADMAEAAGIEDVVDVMREAAVETTGDLVVLFVEADDEWFAVARTDDDYDARIFLSDTRASLTSDLGAFLYEAVIGDNEEPPNPDPIGDAQLLEDLGINGPTLLTLSERLPGDALATIAEQAGFPEEYDRLR
jgi:putative tRNA adenosine deaminase-associated protein